MLCCVDGYTFASSNQCDSICILYIELKCVVKSNFNWTYDTTHKSTGHSNENAGMKCFICGGTFDSGFRIIYLLSFRSILFDCSNLISYIYLLTIVMLNATHVNMCISCCCSRIHFITFVTIDQFYKMGGFSVPV